ANYINHLFAFFMVVVYFTMSLKVVYSTLIYGAGHFKQFTKYVLIEVVINIVISVVTVSKFDLIGVTLGTIVALIYRIFVSIDYLKSNIIFRTKAISYKLF